MARPRSKRTPSLTYPLAGDAPNQNGGYVQHWLTVGPYDQRLTVAPLPGETFGAFAARWLAKHSRSEVDYVNVVELDRVRLGEDEQFWEVTHCQDDHWLAWFGFLPVHTYRQVWGYVHLHSARAQEVMIVCTASCAVRLWLNEQSLSLSAHPTLEPTSFRGVCDEESPPAGVEKGIPPVGRNDAATYSVTAKLSAGANRLLMRLEAIGVREVTMGAALRVEQVDTNAAPISVQVPTVSRAPRRRQRLEEIYAQARLDRAVYGKGDPVRLLAPARAKKTPVQLRLQKASGAIYAETIGALDAGTVIESVRGSQLPNGALDAVVMAPFQHFYNEKLRARHITSILVANQPFYAHAPVQSSDERLIEVLRAQTQAAGSTYAELAKMAFGWWEQVDHAAIHRIVERVVGREADVLPDLLGLVTMQARMPAYRGFPQTVLPELYRGLAAFAMGGDDAAAWDGEDEGNQLMLMTARHLLGQLYPGTGGASVDADTLMAWMAARGRTGFRQWHSDHDHLVMALATLVTLAQEDSVREMAAALLDMLAFALATHSFGGVFGASRARVTAATLRSGRFAPEAALNRLLWGAGGYQSGLAATVALGLAGASYTLPDVVAAIALAQPQRLWVQERHGDTNMVSYKTPDYLLSSAQDYRVGKRGVREQIWQATLGAEALVFANHPASYQQSDGAAPGWWVGNGALPRVAQYHDTLIARYRLPADDWLNFTHAYFPIYAFDEHHLVDGWAFARVGDGYLALWAAPNFTFVENGPDGGRELRVLGREAAWLCQMGRRAVDGDFGDFQRKVLATTPQCHDEQVTWTTVRGDSLTLGSVGPLLVDGQALLPDNFPRHSSLFGQADFPADHFDIVYGADGLRLHF